jgi:membrane-associated phospholipid phosphatase
MTSGASEGYVPQLSSLMAQSAGALLRSPSHSRRAEARRMLARHSLWLMASLSALIIILMFLFDATEIAMMPTRGSPELWPVRIFTDFGKDEYILWVLAAMFVMVAIAYPLVQSRARPGLARFAIRVEYFFFAVALPVFAAEAIKWTAGRGRPFVGGKANAFNFVPFTGTEAFASFPSAHAVTAFALAFGIVAIWPRFWVAAFTYALLIGASRLVLLAHHPSDVVGGALIGLVGAMAVRYWFAARRVGFDIKDDGKIVPL